MTFVLRQAQDERSRRGEWDSVTHSKTGRTKIITQVDEKIGNFDNKIDKKTEEVIHRFQIITENLEDKVKQVAEGVRNLNEKLDRHINEINKNLELKHQDVLAAIKFSYAELDRRITTLEIHLKQLDERVRRLESH